MTDTAKLTRGIYKRGSTYWLAFQRAGKRRWLTLETDDPLEAVSRAETIRAHKFSDEPTPMSKAVAEFLAEKKRLNQFSKATARVHGAALAEFAERVEGRGLEAITERLASDHYAALQERVAETTAQIHIRALRAFFAWCVKSKLCRANPFAGLRLAKIDQAARVVFCTKKQRDALIEEAPDDDLLFILLAGFEAGLRKNEIIEARVHFFDLKGGAIHLQNTETLRLKDNEARTIPMTKRLRKFLRGYLAGKKPNDFALLPEVAHGKGTYRYDFHRPFNDYLDRREKFAEHVAAWHEAEGRSRRTMTFNGQRVTAHVMRHTFASLLVQAGVSIYKVAKWLGDGVEVVEEHYGHLAPKDADIERAR